MQRFHIAILLIAIASPTWGQLYWGDDFDNGGTVGSAAGPYAPGPVGTFGASSGGVNNPANGGWNAWYTNPFADGGISSARFRSAPHSLEIGGPGVLGSGCDMVQEHSVASSLPGNPGAYGTPGTFPQSTGLWEYRAWNYVQSSFPTGTASHYFLVTSLQNNATSGPTEWIVQVQFNHVTGTVAEDFLAPPTPATILYDQWVEIVITLDLDNQVISGTYGGQCIATGNLAFGPGGVRIDTLDLFTVGATSYWDDVTLTQITVGAPLPPGGTGTTVTVMGSNLGTDPDDLCMIAMNGGLALPFDAIAANNTWASGVALDLPPGALPGPLMIEVGDGAQYQNVQHQPGEPALTGWAWKPTGQPAQVVAQMWNPNANACDLVVTDTGGGGGTVEIQNIPPGTDEGYTLFSFNTGPVAQDLGQFLSTLSPPTLLQLFLSLPATPGDFFHWTWPVAPPLYPAAPFTFPPPVLPQGLQVDLMAVKLDTNPPGSVSFTPVRRVTFTNPLPGAPAGHSFFSGPADAGGVLKVKISGTWTPTTKIKIVARAHNHGPPAVGIDCVIPCMTFTSGGPLITYAQRICFAIVTFFQTHGITILCNAVPMGNCVEISIFFPNNLPVQWGNLNITVLSP